MGALASKFASYRHLLVKADSPGVTPDLPEFFHGLKSFALLSAQDPHVKPEIQGGNAAMANYMASNMGLKAIPTQGRYRKPEESFIVLNPTKEQALHLGKKFGQESVIWSNGKKHYVLFTNGADAGKVAKHLPQLDLFDKEPKDFFTKIPGPQGRAQFMRMHFDWDNLLDHDAEFGADVPAEAVAKPPDPSKTNKSEEDLAKATDLVNQENSDRRLLGDDPQSRMNEAKAAMDAVTAKIRAAHSPVEKASLRKELQIRRSHFGQVLVAYKRRQVAPAPRPLRIEVRPERVKPTALVPDSPPPQPRQAPAGVQVRQRPVKPQEMGTPYAGQKITPDPTVRKEHLPKLQHPSGYVSLWKNGDGMPFIPHPLSYEWHDGHTTHHAPLDPAPPLPITKAMPHPHTAGAPQENPHLIPPPAPGVPIAPPLKLQHLNNQAAGVGVKTYAQFAQPYGQVNPGTKTDLLHYDYHGRANDAKKLVAQHGFKSYYAGGRFGKPDLLNRNYNTRWLMVYDPSPDSGASFQDQGYTDAWRHVHELAHAVTYPELNQMYGEGRRIGKLGTHRTLREAKRAVHWEWLAAHKQRELNGQLGIHVPDDVFHRELNTVMHDAVHRAVTGKFTEPSDEGFTPHSHKVPLETALGMVDAEARRQGLPDHNTLITRKSEGDDEAMSDKQTYTIPEALKVLAKAMRDRIEAFQPKLEELQKKEQAKRLCPTCTKTHAGACHKGVEPMGKREPDSKKPPADTKATAAHDQDGKLPHDQKSKLLNPDSGSGGKIVPGKKLAKSDLQDSVEVEMWLHKTTPVKRFTAEEIAALNGNPTALVKAEAGKKLIADAPGQPSALTPNARIPEDIQAGKSTKKKELDARAPTQPAQIEANSHLPEDLRNGKSTKKKELDARAPTQPSELEANSHLPEDVDKKAMNKCGDGEESHGEHSHGEESSYRTAKKAEPPMAKPPSGKSPTQVPVSKNDSITQPLDVSPGKPKPSVVAPLTAKNGGPKDHIAQPLDVSPGKPKPSVVAPLTATGAGKPNELIAAPLDVSPGKPKPSVVAPITKALGEIDPKSAGAPAIPKPAPSPLKLPGSIVRGKPMTGTPSGHINAGTKTPAPIKLPGMGVPKAPAAAPPAAAPAPAAPVKA